MSKRVCGFSRRVPPSLLIFPWFTMLRVCAVLVFALLVLVGCSESDPVSSNEEGNGNPNPDPGPVELQPTLTSIQQHIFSPKCALSGCHAGSVPAQGMSLEGGAAHGNLVGVASVERSDLLRVEAGTPDESYLVKKIRGDADIEGTRMPLGRTPLSADEIAIIRQWISEGAADN